MRGKHATLIAAILLLTTACSRSTPAPAGTTPGTAPSVPELPPAQVALPAEAIVSTLDLASLPKAPMNPMPAKPPAAGEAEREQARANLVSLLYASTTAPAKGLEDALLAYYRRPDVAGLYPPLADPPLGVQRVTELGGSKDEPSPTRPTVIRVFSPYAGTPWYLSLLQWQSGGKVFTAPLKETIITAVRGVTYQGRPAFLLFSSTDPNAPEILSAYVDKDGQLQPVALPDQAPVDGANWVRKAPNQLQFPLQTTAVKPDFGWACFTQSCITLGWSDAKGLTVTPAGFGVTAASQRLSGTDGNVVQTGLPNAEEAINDRVSALGAMDLSVRQLADRIGAGVVQAAAGDTIARVVSITGSNWLGGKGYQTAATWLLVRSPGAPDQAFRLGGGAYYDHRVLRDGDQTYILLLSEAEPRPDTARNVLRIFALQGGKLQQLQFPDTLHLNRNVFVSMDGRLMLTCTDVVTTAACGAVRIEGGKLAVLAKGALPARASAEAQQAREKATAKFKAGAYVEAVQTFRQTVELAPAWVDAWNDLSFAYQKAGDWSAALSAARTANNLDIKSGAAWYNIGVSYLGMGDASAALVWLDQATKLQPDNPDTWLALAKAQEQAHGRATAAESYKQVLALDPGNKEAADGLKRVEAK